MIHLALLTAALASFNCDISAPVVISKTKDGVLANPMDGLPKEALSFGMEIVNNKMVVNWPDSPIQMNGKQVILATGTGAGMALFLSRGPCLFTEQACGTLVNYAQQQDGSLQLLITPSALVSDESKKNRAPFLVAIDGQCLPKAGAK